MSSIFSTALEEYTKANDPLILPGLQNTDDALQELLSAQEALNDHVIVMEDISTLLKYSTSEDSDTIKAVEIALEATINASKLDYKEKDEKISEKIKRVLKGVYEKFAKLLRKLITVFKKFSSFVDNKLLGYNGQIKKLKKMAKEVKDLEPQREWSNARVMALVNNDPNKTLPLIEKAAYNITDGITAELKKLSKKIGAVGNAIDSNAQDLDPEELTALNEKVISKYISLLPFDTKTMNNGDVIYGPITDNLHLTVLDTPVASAIVASKIPLGEDNSKQKPLTYKEMDSRLTDISKVLDGFYESNTQIQTYDKLLTGVDELTDKVLRIIKSKDEINESVNEKFRETVGVAKVVSNTAMTLYRISYIMYDDYTRYLSSTIKESIQCYKKA